ncbi:MAG TPA: preprotein translocase subunit SecE [Jatrophihabitans sp.]
MTETQAAPAPSSRPDKSVRGSSGGGLALLWRWLPLLITALRRRFRETVAEMRKVLWPSRKEMTTYTIVVIIFVVIMVSLVAGLDLGFAKLVLAVFG